MIIYENIIRLFQLFHSIFGPGVTQTADCRVAQAEGVEAAQMEKAEQAKLFDKQTNNLTNKQTEKQNKLIEE